MKKEEKELTIKEKREEQARKNSIKEGSFASISGGAGSSYITPFALALGANNSQIGLLASLPGILNPLAQLRGSRLIEKYSRKKVVVSHVLAEVIMWLVILGIALLTHFELIGHSPTILIILWALFAFIGGMSAPAWFSWLGDIVPQEIRGEYFAKRGRIIGAITLISMLIASIFYHFLY
jgi:MFS family permease